MFKHSYDYLIILIKPVSKMTNVFQFKHAQNKFKQCISY